MTITGYYSCHTWRNRDRSLRLYQLWSLRGDFGRPSRSSLGSSGLDLLLSLHVTFSYASLQVRNAA